MAQAKKITTDKAQGADPVMKAKELTVVKSVKVNPKLKEEVSPLKDGDQFLFIKDGQEVYYTRATANVLFQRNTANIEIPKGSDYTPPQGSKCKGCE